MKTANVLGVRYTIEDATEQKYPYLSKVDGFCDTSIKRIVIRKFKPSEDSIKDLESYRRKCIRHELIHAFLFESGLDINSDWARNEEIVDWIAIQSPKLSKLFTQLGIN